MITGLSYIEDPSSLVGGNAAQLLCHGREVFPAWLEAIDAATERIALEMYIFSDDVIGRRFAQALLRAVGRGVFVRVIYDFVGCRETPATFFQRLRAGGVHVIAYHRYHFWRPRFWALLRRNHRKTLICDGRVAFTGGLNISDEWMDASEGGGGWHDAAIKLEGPAVTAIELTFLRLWNRRARRRERLDVNAVKKPAPAGDTPVAVVANTEVRERFAIRRTGLHAMRESRARLYLANPYFVPDRGIMRALEAAARRGVDVRVLVPLHSDTRLLDLAARAVFEPLLAAGVRIWRSVAVIHTKLLAVDDHFLSIGSYNLDHRSLTYNLELVVNLLDPRCTAGAIDMLATDMAACTELTRERFARRSWLDRLAERLAYSLRHWL